MLEEKQGEVGGDLRVEVSMTYLSGAMGRGSWTGEQGSQETELGSKHTPEILSWHRCQWQLGHQPVRGEVRQSQHLGEVMGKGRPRGQAQEVGKRPRRVWYHRCKRLKQSLWSAASNAHLETAWGIVSA